MSVNALANQCGIAPSTIYSMLNTKSKNPGVVSIQKICDGLEISVREFFDDPLFDRKSDESGSDRSAFYQYRAKARQNL